MQRQPSVTSYQDYDSVFTPIGKPGKKCDFSTLNKRDAKFNAKTAKQPSLKKKKSKKPTRTRKSQCQKDVLWKIYKELNGATPSKDKITDLSNELNLSENQIYKWFWDTKKKVDEDNSHALKIGHSFS